MKLQTSNTWLLNAKSAPCILSNILIRFVVHTLIRIGHDIIFNDLHLLFVIIFDEMILLLEIDLHSLLNINDILLFFIDVVLILLLVIRNFSE